MSDGKERAIKRRDIAGRGPQAMTLRAEREADWALGRDLERKDNEIALLRAPLLAWKKTPGNKRTAAWWYQWHASMDAALAAHGETEPKR